MLQELVCDTYDLQSISVYDQPYNNFLGFVFATFFKKTISLLVFQLIIPTASVVCSQY